MNPTQPESTTAPVKPEAKQTSALSPTPKPKMTKKKIILIASIVGGALLLALVGAVVFLAVTTASKQDYREAAVQYNTLSSANSVLTRNITALSSGLTTATDDEFDSSIKRVEESIATLKKENEELGDLKAVRVGDGKDLYNTFDAKLSNNIAYSVDMVSTVKTIRPIMVVCSKVSKEPGNPARLAAAKDCSTALNTVGDISNAQYSAFIGSLKVGYADYARDIESFLVLTDPYGTQFEQYKILAGKINATQRTLSKASTDFSAAVRKTTAELSVKDSANALGKYLREQQIN